MATCEKCRGSGLLPSKKDGRVVPHVRIHCECHRGEIEHYQPVSIDDYDFPMSDSFRGFSFEYCGVQDQAYPPDPLPLLREDERGAAPLFRPRPVDAEIDQLKAQFNFLYQKITELRAEKKKTRGEY